MSNEFRPGHPVVFWISIVVLTFAFYSGGMAGVTADKCNSDVSSKKAWVMFPPHWVCGESGVKLTSSD